jgi:hypothetical protein
LGCLAFEATQQIASSKGNSTKSRASERQKRKGVNTMKYEKPLILQLTDALSAVRGSDPPRKGPAGVDGTDLTHETVPAYQADE